MRRRGSNLQLQQVSNPPGSEPFPPIASVSVYSNIDGLDSELRLAGWAWSAKADEQPITIHVYENNVLLAQGSADCYRADIKAAGYGDGNAGFVLPLPDAVFDGTSHRLEVHVITTAGPVAKSYDVFLPAKRRRVPSAPPHLAVKSDARSGVYVPGQVVTYGPGMTMPSYNTHGWGWIDNCGVWMQGTDAVLEFLIRRPADSYMLEIEVAPGALDIITPTLELFFNYMRIGFASVPLPRFVTFRLPGELFLLRKSVIGFHCREALSPSYSRYGRDSQAGVA